VATAFHELMSRAPVGLDRLNEAERRVLRLLAQGHTAKSIANAIDSTPAAVNERLREARRKTGVGSSRELARLLRAQENRHEQMGVGKASLLATTPSQSDAEPWRPQAGVLAMFAFFVVAAAGAAALISQAPRSRNDVDPLVSSALVRFPQPADLHAKLRTERRDLAWAPLMETAIRARALQIPLVGKGGNALRVTCATDLCEIAGTLLSPPSKKEVEDQNSPYSRAVNALQVAPFTDDLMRLGLKVESGSFTNGEGKPDRAVFLLYYSRKK
jgi:DNA-binding CsgD family transcriptional regulator